MERDRPADNIASAIFKELRRRILTNELVPGERLPGERELAAEYRTNRNTLREAVRRLEQARLVTVRVHAGGQDSHPVDVSAALLTGTAE